MPKIRVLSDQMINQIAAGEVIENPASVVKELMENAIDAGASQISIEIKAGGMQLIRIVDNGCGMAHDDALLSLERHATSKITAIEDLFSLQTMGFRGEALASIAAISKLTLMTAHGIGTEIEVEGGKIIKVGSCARTQGTTIEVRSLFFNVPARKKFQKSTAVCSAEIFKVVTGLSLAYPEISFELIAQDGSSLSAQGPCSLKERMRQVLGENFISNLIPIHLEEGRIKLSGFIGAPTKTRHNRTGQYLYINQRLVVSPLVSFAVREGYATRIGTDRHPIFVLHLKILPNFIDVNVHPQKKEVRMHDEEWMKETIKKAVLRAFQEEQKIVADPTTPHFLFHEPLSTPFETPLCFKEEEVIVELPLQDSPRFIGVYAHVLFVEKKELLLVDLNAAQSLIAFEKLLHAQKITSQMLMIPVTVEFSTAESELIKAHLKNIEAMGIQIRPLDRNAFIIDALPPFLDSSNVVEVLQKMTEELRDGFDEMKVAKALLKNGRRSCFSLYEAQAIYEELLKMPSPLFAPDGRKIIRTMDQEKLVGLFDGKD